MHRNFMGYTTQPSRLMVGLGVSAIGDTWTAFGQNVKVVERYLELVKEGKFPVYRGHVLSDEDLSIRKIILDIMCHFRGDLSGFEPSDLASTMEALGEMVKDQLVIEHRNEIEITKEGRAFVRNVCMAFDKRLIRKKPDTHIFSMTL